MSILDEGRAFVSNDDFHLLLDNVLDVVAVIRPDGRLDFVSESVRHVLGYEPSELIGSNGLDLFHPEDRFLVAELIGGPDTSKEGHLYLARYRHADGSWRTLEASGKRLPDGRVVIAARDITERLATEAELRQSRGRLQTVVNSAPVIIWVLDAEGVITFSDGKGLRDLGYPAQTLVGRSVFAGNVPLPELCVTARRALNGEAFSFLAHARGRTYSTRYEPVFDADGRFDSTVCVATDITELWYAERRMRFQAAVLSGVRQGAIAVDRGNRVLFWNTAAEQLLGWSKTETIGKEIRALYASARAGSEPNESALAVFEGGTWSGEVLITRRDGTRFPAQISKTPVREDGEIIGVATIFEDISARRASETALRTSEERYALAARGSNAGLWDWDLTTGRVFYAERWKQMLGLDPKQVGETPEEWLGRIHPEEVDDVRDAISRHLAHETPHFEAEYRIAHQDGAYGWVVARGIAVFDGSGAPVRFAGSQTDVTERKVAEEQLLQNAFFDGLTGLPNRALFVDRLGRMIARAKRRPDISFALLFLDLDRFKNVNDSLGHGQGDALLVRAARRLERCMRANDTFARLGGDEFGVLLDDMDDVGDATAMAERIQKSLIEPLQLDGHDIFISVSIGIALSAEPEPAPLPASSIAGGSAESIQSTVARTNGPEMNGHYTDAQNMLRDADTAMYRAKSLGKARHEVFNSAMHKHAFDLLRTENELRRAIERNELETHYQPIVGLKDGELVSFEALIRWRHPERGLVPPDEFVPIAEDSGLILALGQWVLRDVCRQMRAWKDNAEIKNCNPCVAVNISSRQFTPTLVQQVRQCLEEFNLGPECIKLEITESVIMENAASAAAMLHELKELGVHLSIDDFGTGYSSLAALYQFPLDTLKVDRSFVRRLTATGENDAIVTSILSLADSLNLGVVAEGIENEEQYDHLRRMGCGCGQGFLMSRPVPAAEAQVLLDAAPYWWQFNKK